MGRFPLDFSLVPRSLLTHVCEQLELESPLFVVYPQRQPTRYEHVERLKTYLGLRLFTSQDAQQLTVDVRQHIGTGMRLHELLPTIEQQLRTRGVVLPGVTVVERLVNLARGTAEEEVCVELAARLSADTKSRLLALLDVQPGQRLPTFQQLQRTASRPSPEAFSHDVELLQQVQEILPEGLDNLFDTSAM